MCVLLLSQERRVKKKLEIKKSIKVTVASLTKCSPPAGDFQTCISLKCVKMALDESAKSQTQKENVDGVRNGMGGGTA